MDSRAPQGLELIPGALALHILDHELAASAPVPCWSFVSDGLATIGQREVVFTLKRRPDEKLDEAVAEVGILFRTLHQLASQGRFVDVGGVTLLGENSRLFGRRGLIYTEAKGLGDLNLPEGALAAHLLTADEAMVSQELSAVRVLGRLGLQSRFLPWPAWSDRDRGAVASFSENTMLAQMMRLSSPGLEVFGLGSEVVLSVTREGAAAIVEALAERPAEAAFALTGTPVSRGDGYLVWHPGQTEAQGIAIGESQPFRMVGSFLALAPEVEEDQVVKAEDGFVVMLREESWRGFVAALEAVEGFRLDREAGGFHLMIRDAAAPRRFEMALTLGNAEERFESGCGLEQLADLVAAADRAAQDCGVDLTGASLELSLTSPGKVAIKISGLKSSETEILRAAVKAVLPPLLLRGEELSLALNFGSS